MSAVTPISVTTPTFEGPIDLLLQLIETKNLQINTVSLSEVTELYLDTINKAPVSAEKLLDFIRIASILIYIKSQSLLPKKSYYSALEERGVEVLQQHLKLLKYIRSFASTSVFLTQRMSLIRRGGNTGTRKNRVFDADPELTPALLAEIARFSYVTPASKVPEVTVKPTVTLEVMVDRIVQTLNTMQSLNFDKIPIENKKDAVVLFLAVLELFKQNKVQVEQQGAFGSMTVTR